MTGTVALSLSSCHLFRTVMPDQRDRREDPYTLSPRTWKSSKMEVFRVDIYPKTCLAPAFARIAVMVPLLPHCISDLEMQKSGDVPQGQSVAPSEVVPAGPLQKSGDGSCRCPPGPCSATRLSALGDAPPPLMSLPAPAHGCTALSPPWFTRDSLAGPKSYSHV